MTTLLIQIVTEGFFLWLVIIWFQVILLCKHLLSALDVTQFTSHTYRQGRVTCSCTMTNTQRRCHIHGLGDRDRVGHMRRCPTASRWVHDITTSQDSGPDLIPHVRSRVVDSCLKSPFVIGDVKTPNFLKVREITSAHLSSSLVIKS